MADRPRPGEVEQRAAPAPELDGPRIRGLIPYATESRDMGGWREVIDAGALSATNFDELVVTVDHEGLPLGRFPTTLSIEERSDGLHWSVDPPKSREDIREAVERGDLKGGSWRMVVARDRWEGNTRHVLAISHLRDVAIVTSPAYASAGVELRSAPETEVTETEQEMEDHQQDQQDETRGRPAAGSLRVEQRSEQPTFVNLADAYAQRGFFETRSAEVGWDEFRSLVWGGGTVLTDLNPIRREGVGLGYDQRWLFPVLPQTAVSDATTAISYMRQSGRTLAGTSVIRPLDAVTTKPSTGGTVELVSGQLQQVASIHPDVPRIHAAQPLFQSIVGTDLRLSVNDGLDELVRRGVSTAGTAAAVTGNVLDKIRKAKTVIQAQGYNPDVLAIDPAGAESLDLLKSSGSEALYVFQPGSGAPSGPWGVSVRIWKNSGTALLDSQSFGRLYVSPVELRSFEQDAGATNRQTVRMETNALYAVERLSAGLRIV